MNESADQLVRRLRGLEAQVTALEQALARAQHREQRVLEGVPDMLFWTNGRGEVLDFRVPDDHLLVPRDQVLGWRVTTPPMPAVAGQGWLQAILACLREGTPQVVRYELNLPAGVRQQEARFVRLDDDRVLVMARDLTSDGRRATRSQDSLADEHQRILQSLRDLVWSARIDAQGKFHFRYFSPAVAQITGRPPEFFLEGLERLRSVLHPDDWVRFEAAIADLASGRRQESEEVYRMRRLDGQTRWVTDRLRAQRVGDEVFLTGVVSDITEARRVEERLRESQRLEELGQLAGGIAHDFNNLLVGMLGGAELVAAQLGESHPAHAALGLIQDSATRAAELCQQMLAYAGKADMLTEIVELTQVTRDMLPLLLASVGKHVQLHLEIGEQPLRVRADVGQIRRILLNLVKNASDAVPSSGGAVRVSLSARELDEAFLSHAVAGEPMSPGPCVVLRVVDEGAGMDSQVRERMFEPFFSTKEHGHGLGLSAVLGIVRAHRGALHVTSTPGKGSCIEVALPAAMPEVDVAPKARSQPAPRNADTPAVVLVIDDEETVLAVATSILSADGYETHGADSGRRGLQLFDELQGQVSVVVLDMTMPGLSGPQVYRELRARSPELPIVVCSGYSEEDALGSLAQQYEVSFLSKPYRAAQLREAIAKVLQPRESSEAIEAGTGATPPRSDSAGSPPDAPARGRRTGG